MTSGSGGGIIQRPSRGGGARPPVLRQQAREDSAADPDVQWWRAWCPFTLRPIHSLEAGMGSKDNEKKNDAAKPQDDVKNPATKEAPQKDPKQGATSSAPAKLKGDVVK
jgi:hypothetical protein